MNKAQLKTVVLIGASVRAAAYSALRAGLAPYGIDLFADTDLREIAETCRCSFDDYPQGFSAMLRAAPPGPIIYTGGLENEPLLIEEIAQSRTIWGNDAATLRRSRFPFFVAALLNDEGMKTLAVSRSSLSVHSLRKPLKSAGGAQISFANPADSQSDMFYYQQFMPGPSYSAVFCAGLERAALLGVTEQLTGETWLHAKPFHYCGSIGPIELSDEVKATLVHMGEGLQNGCGMRGLFGIDFILKDEYPWLIEVNPRYTASIEVIEHATGLIALEHHREAFGERGCLTAPPEPARPKKVVGKAILFSPTRFVFPDGGPWTKTPDLNGRPDFADIPSPGERIEEGWPILTLFAEALNPVECRKELQRRTADFFQAVLTHRSTP